MRIIIDVRYEGGTYFVAVLPSSTETVVPYFNMEGRNLQDLMRQVGSAQLWTLIENRLTREARQERLPSS